MPKIVKAAKLSVRKTQGKQVQSLKKSQSKGSLLPNKKARAGTANSVRKISKALSIPIYNLTGRKTGVVSLPKEIFGAKVNEKLMAQAVRVYLANQRQGTASTKTRGEVTGSTRKIYRQKGTGRARHGAIRAPIFVGGGIVFGPRPRDFGLKLSKRMKKKALFSALSQKVREGKIMAVDENKFSGKTVEAAHMFRAIGTFKRNRADKILFVTEQDKTIQASRNIGGVKVIPPHSVSTYEVLDSNYLMFGKDAITKMEEIFLRNSN